VIAQIDEQNPAMIANAMTPAGEPNSGSDVGLAQSAASVGAVAVHHPARRSRPAKDFVRTLGKRAHKRMRH
jgi:hypothetical protein